MFRINKVVIKYSCSVFYWHLIEMDSFYLHLQSNASAKNYNDNTITNFRNEIIPNIQLESNSYECALVDVSYVYEEPMVYKGSVLYTIARVKRIKLVGKHCALDNVNNKTICGRNWCIEATTIYKTFTFGKARNYKNRAQFTAISHWDDDADMLIAWTHVEVTLSDDQLKEVKKNTERLGFPTAFAGAMGLGRFEETLTGQNNIKDVYSYELFEDAKLVKIKILTSYEKLNIGNTNIPSEESEFIDFVYPSNVEGINHRSVTRKVDWLVFKRAVNLNKSFDEVEAATPEASTKDCDQYAEIDVEYVDVIASVDRPLFRIDKWMKKEFRKPLQIERNEGYVRLEIEIRKPWQEVQIESHIEEVLGMNEYKVDVAMHDPLRIELRIAKFPLDNKHGSRQIYLYTDLIDYIHIGDTTAPLLRNFKYDGSENNQLIQQEFTNPHYKPIIKDLIQEIHVYLRTEMNRTPALNSGAFSATLHVRRRL